MGIMDVLLQSWSLVALLTALTVWLVYSFQNQRKEPPGPMPLPLIGNLLQLDVKAPYNSLMELSKKYGEIFTVYLGTKKVVVLTGYKAVKEALVTFDDVFGERDPPAFMNDYSQGHGVIWANGDSWKEMRRFSLSNLRDFGMGKKICEDKIIEESHHLIEVFNQFKGEAFDTTQPMNYTISNVISLFAFGRRFEYDEPEFVSMMEGSVRRIEHLGSPSVQRYNSLPRLFRWAVDLGPAQAAIRINKENLWAIINRLKEMFDPQACRSFVDAFLLQQQKLAKSGTTNRHFHSDNLLNTVSNLFAAGSETTSTTLRWGLLFMTKYPKIQDQVQEELRRVVGIRQVQLSDRKSLHFTNAVIHEVQRLANLTPLALPHKTTQDISFHGYFIKKGTTVCPLLMSVLYDETEWERPRSFHPAHFLDANGEFVKRDAFIPFSAGRRICLGEGLARMELFIFFCTLLQHFRFTPPPGVSEDDLDLTPHPGFTLAPLPHKLCAVAL
ncbi:cytochrome P450 2K1-like isoform X2 [Salarias fasciatus]|nr:cytochrome P450 2K1-like isoform X2 [Salarias fasciatus]